MTRAGAIAAKDAELLNSLAQKVSPMLFWTCNYEPSLIETVGPDAEYLLNIQDLYQFSIDTNCILKHIAYRDRKSICPNALPRYERLRLLDDLNLVQTLRGYVDHNQSERNGRTSSVVISDYWLWVKNVLNKDDCSDAKDYERLNEELQRVGNSLVERSKRIVRNIKESTDREAIVRTWIDAIITWYCSNPYNTYYRGQLEGYYMARASRANVNFAFDTEGYELRAKTNRWISTWAEAGLQTELDELLRRYDELQSAINDSYLWADAANRLSAAEANALRQELDNESIRLEQEIDDVKAEQEEFNRREGYNKVLYYYDPARLSRQLRATLSRLIDDGEEFTLLPQDFLLCDIEHHFASVPSPDRDFA